MKKRILAWVLLIGFVLLLLNILVLQIYLQLSIIVYLMILFAFLLSNGKFNLQGSSQKYDQPGVPEVDPDQLEGDDAGNDGENEMGSDQQDGENSNSKQ